MFKPVAVKALPDYRLWIQFADGVEGEVDLSSLVGKGVFAAWNDAAAFQGVTVGPYGELAWSDEIELCPDALYFEITGQTPEQAFSTLYAEILNA